MTPYFHSTVIEDDRPGSEVRTGMALSLDTVLRFEPWQACSIAVFMPAVALLTSASFLAASWFVLYALLIGKDAREHGSGQSSRMAFRGLALLAGSSALYAVAANPIGALGTLLFFWLGITSMFYALTLKPAWGAGFVPCALLAFALLYLQERPDAGWPELTSPAGVAMLPLLLAMGLGFVIRRPGDAALDQGRIDCKTALHNLAVFDAHGNRALAACTRGQRPLSVVLFDCADLLEVRYIYGSQVSRQLTMRLVGRLKVLAGADGLVARTGPTQFTLVLPGLGHEETGQAIQRVLGLPSRVEIEAGDSEIVVVPDYMIKTAHSETASISQIYQDLCRDLSQIQQHEYRRQEYLKRERERHSNPQPLASERHHLHRQRSNTVSDGEHA